jgi:branched-chain amino acid transport system ATP-binding protein
MRLLGSFRTEGLSLLIAEQNVKFLEFTDRVYTLEGGRIGYAGWVAAMQENDALRKAYFGLK